MFFFVAAKCKRFQVLIYLNLRRTHTVTLRCFEHRWCSNFRLPITSDRSSNATVYYPHFPECYPLLLQVGAAEFLLDLLLDCAWFSPQLCEKINKEFFKKILTFFKIYGIIFIEIKKKIKKMQILHQILA